MMQLKAAVVAATVATAAAAVGTWTDVFHFKGKVVCDMRFMPDGERLLAAEKRGRFKIHHPATQIEVGDRGGQIYLNLAQHPLGVQDDTELGVLGFAFAPNFPTVPYIYVYWSPLTHERFRVSRFTHSENAGGTTSRANLESEVVLWEDTEGYLGCCHYGGGMVFGLDGYLYFGTGDKFTGFSVTQNVSSGGGKLHRINADGSIPADNMGMDDGAGGEMVDSMYAIGLRNPYSIVLEPGTGRLLIADVGGNDQNTAWEEVHIGRARKNFGWPLCEGPCGTEVSAVDFSSCNCQKYDSPAYAYPHNPTYGGPLGKGASVIGGFVYRGGWANVPKEHALPNEYLGKYLFADYALRKMFAVTIPAEGENTDSPPFPIADPDILPTAQETAPAVVTEGPDGSFWYGNSFGQIRRVQFIRGNVPPAINAVTPTPSSGEPPLEVTFESDVSDADGDKVKYEWVVIATTDRRGEKKVTNDKPSFTHTFHELGTYIVTLTVSDDGGSSNLQTEVSVGFPPIAQITSPAHNSLFRAEQTINFQAFVEEDVTYVWTLQMKHNEHFHPEFEERPGTSMSFVVDSTGHAVNEEISYIMKLEAMSPEGIVSTAQVTLLPDLVQLTVNSIPPGLSFNLDGLPVTTPATFNTLIGYHHSVSVGPVAIINGETLAFNGWVDSDEPSRVLALTVPDSAATVTFQYEASRSVRIVGFNCGGPTLTDANGVRWISDVGIASNGKALTTGVQASLEDITEVLLVTERYAGWSGGLDSIVFEVPVLVPGTYALRLVFIESYWKGEGNRVFNILVDGILQKADVDPVARCGYRVPCVMYVDVATTAPFLTLSLEKAKGSVDKPILNVLEVLRVEVASPTAPTSAPTAMPTEQPTTPAPTTQAPSTAAPTISLASTSEEACSKLGWSFKYGNTAVCGVSDINGCHRNSHTLIESAELCSGAWGRLCTLDEVESDAVRGTGCNIDTALMWTSTPCNDGKGVFVTYGRDTPGAEPTCAEFSTWSTAKYSSRCCADAVVDVPSGGGGAAEVSLLSEAKMPAESSLLCSHLQWPFKYGNTEVCGASTVDGTCHVNDATLPEAAEICSKAGGRLCTLAEVEANVVTGTGCNIDTFTMWTSTLCNEGTGVYVRTGKPNAAIPPQCIVPTADVQRSIRCCADRVQDEAGPSEPTEPVRSTALCKDLGWQFKYGNTDVCAASTIDNTCHQSDSTFDQAEAICTGQGARLCTLAELEADVARGTGCSLDYSVTWTSTPCSNGHGAYARTGRYDVGRAATCTVKDTSTLRSVRCCADRTAEAVESDWEDGVVALSPQSCYDLGWGFKWGNTQVCGESVLDGECYVQTATYAAAADVCADAGGRLCTLAEVEAHAVTSTGCGIDSQLIWTQSLCNGGNGAYVRTGKFEGNAATCETNSRARLSIRCCGDRVGAGASAADGPTSQGTLNGLSGYEATLLVMSGFAAAVLAGAIMMAMVKKRDSERRRSLTSSQSRSTLSAPTESMDARTELSWEASTSRLHRRNTSASTRV